MLAWGLWKGIGWSAIIYIAAISGIDQQLYEAATVDGAGRFQRMWNITVPSLIPTFCVLLLMSIANILSNGMDQYLVFENSTNTSSIMVLDLYVYKLGIGQGRDSIINSNRYGKIRCQCNVTVCCKRYFETDSWREYCIRRRKTWQKQHRKRLI